ncbi:MAG: class I SAM-dependent methyltransferase [Bdellovibrionales bacterium]
MTQVKNLFVEQEEAKRYNNYRPVYHHLLVEKLSSYFGKKLKRTLDVACGTGHSTNALAKISDHIFGCDLSEAMLNVARENNSINFVQSSAEQLPFEDSAFDYLNISMAFQWLNQSQFLEEAKRVLNENGILGIDNYGFTGKMMGNEGFLNLYKSFDQQYMKPAYRNKNYPEESDLRSIDFQFVTELTYDHEVSMDMSQFINYLMTRSNYLHLSALVGLLHRTASQQVTAPDPNR